MNDYIKLIIFNFVLISLSILFKKNIILFFTFLLLFMLSYEMLLKNKLIEGNYQDELFNSINYLGYNKPQLELPLDKINNILEKMIESLKGTKLISDNECKGKFVVNKLTDKTCGVGFNERVYKILDKGDGNCLHSELYKEKIPLPFCKYSEKCDDDLDCLSNRCNDGLCDFELDCSKDMISGCRYDSCLALNNGLDKNLYYWSDNKCNANPCNENTYELCDESGCNDLSYRFKYDTDNNICKKIIDDDGNTTESTIGNLKEIYTRYKNQGGYESVCKNVNDDAETCNVGADLQPRYYCKENYKKENDGKDGDSNHCEVCQYPDEVTDLSKIDTACTANMTKIQGQNTDENISLYCSSETLPIDILVNDLSNNENCQLMPKQYNCQEWCGRKSDEMCQDNNCPDENPCFYGKCISGTSLEGPELQQILSYLDQSDEGGTDSTGGSVVPPTPPPPSGWRNKVEGRDTGYVPGLLVPCVDGGCFDDYWGTCDGLINPPNNLNCTGCNNQTGDRQTSFCSTCCTQDPLPDGGGH